MSELFRPIILTFIPIFVAVDAIGNIPLFLSLTEGKKEEEKERVIVVSVTVATVVAVLFMLIGKFILRLLNITIPDFQIAGGILLFVIASRLLLPGTQKGILSEYEKDVAVFPLGTPLITGPAVLTTTLMMRDSFGLIFTFTSLVANMIIVWITLAKADTIMRVMGSSGTRAFSKIMYILLAAIGVMMVRRGVMGIKLL